MEKNQYYLLSILKLLQSSWNSWAANKIFSLLLKIWSYHDVSNICIEVNVIPIYKCCWEAYWIYKLNAMKHIHLSGTLFSSSCTRDWHSEQISFLSKKEICEIVSYLKNLKGRLIKFIWKRLFLSSYQVWDIFRLLGSCQIWQIRSQCLSFQGTEIALVPSREMLWGMVFKVFPLVQQWEWCI